MSSCVRIDARPYLRKARLAAGITSTEAASEIVPFSAVTIGRQERGDVPLAPADAVVLARCYDSGELLPYYCAECPVGKARGMVVTERDLPLATLRLTQRLRKAGKEIADVLDLIADDGVVDEAEMPVFDSALSVLKELNASIFDIMLYADMHGIEKEPAQKASTRNSHHYSTA